eukprot:NODE_3_length_80033_cov_0.932970.p28 type:complete len:289 gc:universal NODE_3_length_80033_cov_0.932970:46936-47802(+)
MLIYKLKNKSSKKFLMYFSGGAFLMNHHTMFMHFPKYYPEYNLVFVQYGMSPEFSYPRGIIDAIDAYHTICTKYSPESIVLMGDSAGGHLSLQVAVYVALNFEKDYREEDEAIGRSTRNLSTFYLKPACLVLLSPWTDMTLEGRSVEYNGKNDSIKPSFGLHKFRELYLGLPLESNPERKELPFIQAGENHFRTMPMLTDEDLKRPQFSPFYYDKEILALLPPINIQTGDKEILLSDNESMALKLKEIKVDCKWSVYPFQVHMWQSLPWMETTKGSFEEGRLFVKEHE